MVMNMNPKDLPLSFVMALAQNDTALKKFQELTDSQKNDIADKSRSIKTKREMNSFVNQLPDMNFNLE